MIQTKRNDTIKSLYEKGTKVKLLCKKYGLSKPRIYEILGNEKKHCAKHNRTYYSTCFSCTLEGKSMKLTKTFEKAVRKRWSKNDSVITEEMVKDIIALKDECDWSFVKIGELIGRHYSTVQYHYYRNI